MQKEKNNTNNKKKKKKKKRRYCVRRSGDAWSAAWEKKQSKCMT
jgi:hypothetical protein